MSDEIDAVVAQNESDRATMSGLNLPPPNEIQGEVLASAPPRLPPEGTPEVWLLAQWRWMEYKSQYLKDRWYFSFGSQYATRELAERELLPGQFIIHIPASMIGARS